MNVLMVTAVQAVIKTMTTDGAESSRLLRRLLEPAHLTQFGHEELGTLARYIGVIARADPDLAVDIYEAAYGYEDPDGETPVQMGDSQILGLTTNRRQNYQQAWWALSEALPALLEVDLETGVRAAARAIGGYVRRARPPISGEPSAAGTFAFGDTAARYLPDRSYSWYRGGFVSPQDGPALFKKFDAFLARVATRDDSVARITAVLEVLKGESGLAVFWASLLLLATQHPRLAPMMMPLAISSSAMTGWDTRHALGEYLSAAYTALSVDEREAIELAILTLSGPAGEDAKKRLAGVLPDELVATEAIRAFRTAMAESGAARPNTPIVQITSSISPFDTNAYLAAEGVDVEDPINAALHDSLKEVEDLPVLTTVDSLDAGEARARIAVLEALQRQIEASSGAEVDATLLELAEGKLAEVAAAIARLNRGLLVDDEIRRRLRVLLLALSTSANPHPNAAVEADFQEQLHWGGPSARTSAADGLIRLAAAGGDTDPEVMAAVRRLARDPVCHVRLHIVQNLNLLAGGAQAAWMWSELDHVVSTEATRGVVGAALEAASALAAVDISRAIGLGKAVRDRYAGEDAPGMAACRSLAATFIADLHIWDDVPEADKFFTGCLTADAFDTALISQWIARYSGGLLAGSLTDPADPQHQVRRKTLAFYDQALTTALTSVDQVGARRGLNTFGTWSEGDQAKVRAAFDVVDEVALRLSFAFGAHAQSTASEAEPATERERLYFEVKPILARLADSPVVSIAHNLIQGLEAMIPVDPAGAFETIARCIRASAPGGYAFESLAIPLVVGIVERYLAEHRDIFADPARLGDLVDSLDAFARAGWPEAQALTFRVAEIWR
jgi:hypothetical protein